MSDSTSCDIGDNVCWDLQNCYCFYEVILCLTLYWLIIFSIRVSPLILTIPPIEIKGKMHKLSILFIPRFYTWINGIIILINKLTVSSVKINKTIYFIRNADTQIKFTTTIASFLHSAPDLKQYSHDGCNYLKRIFISLPEYQSVPGFLVVLVLLKFLVFCVVL